MISSMNIDSMNARRYVNHAAAKSVAGFDSLTFKSEHNRARAVFLCNARPHPINGGPGRGAFGLAGFAFDRSVNPVRFTTSRLTAPRGELKKLKSEDAAMATVLTPTQQKVAIQQLCRVTCALRALHKVQLSSPEESSALIAVCAILKAERESLLAATLPRIHLLLGITKGAA